MTALAVARIARKVRPYEAVDLVTPRAVLGELVGELTAYGPDGCPRAVVHLFPLPTVDAAIETARRAAREMWGLDLGEPVQRTEIGPHTLLRFTPTPL